MNAIVNAAPQANLLGIQDVSGRPPVYDPEALPTHLPHVYLYAEKGPTLPQLVSGDALTSLYGTKTLDPRSPYFNHQSVLANEMLGRANQLMVQRIVPSDAGPKSRLVLSIDIVEETVVQYERNIDGTFKLDNTGAKIPTGSPIAGHKAKWVLNDYIAGGDPEDFGTVSSKVGSLTNALDEQSTTYPILEFEANFVGAYGNNLGLRFSAPTSQSGVPMNDTVAEAVKAYLYRLQFVSRTDAASSPQVIETLFGDQAVDFTFKPDAINTKLDTELSIDKILLQSYQDIESPGVPPKYGPFGRMHFYQSNFEQILEMIGALEAPKGLLPEMTMDADSEYLYHVNPFTGTDFHGVPYYTLELVGTAGNGLIFGDNSTYYAVGGSDGTMSLAAFDTAVRDELLNYGDGEASLLDAAMYPQSVMYDTGFGMDTKLAFGTVIGRRKDMWVVVSTQDVSLPQNTAAEESSLAVSLRTAFRNYPESEMYGTPVCRAVVIGHSGYLLNSKYKGLMPLTLEFASKCAQYMSAGNGIWRTGLGFDVNPNNLITMFRDVNAAFKAASVRNRDWDTGLVWVQNYDRRSLFWPAVQTVYDDDSSVLNSAINMMVAVELEKVAQRVWRDLTGVSNLTPAQFIEKSNRMITEQTQGRFDGRVVIRPETFYTAKDEQRGYSWSCKIHMYAPNMQTVGTYTVVAHRLSDLDQGA